MGNGHVAGDVEYHKQSKNKQEEEVKMPKVNHRTVVKSNTDSKSESSSIRKVIIAKASNGSVSKKPKPAIKKTKSKDDSGSES